MGVRPAVANCEVANDEDDAKIRFGRDATGTLAEDVVTPLGPPAVRHKSFINRTERNAMKVLVINNDGGGFADYIEISDGTTVARLFETQVGSARPEGYLIRVNRQPCPADQVLQEGDRISFTPTKIEGAHS
jgi:sulfur carrier protein ThiS